MNVGEEKAKLKPGDKARLDFDFDQGNPAFVPIGPLLVIGVHLDKIDRLDIIMEEGKWSIAKKRPPSIM